MMVDDWWLMMVDDDDDDDDGKEGEVNEHKLFINTLYAINTYLR